MTLSVILLLNCFLLYRSSKKTDEEESDESVCYVEVESDGDGRGKKEQESRGRPSLIPEVDAETFKKCRGQMKSVQTAINALGSDLDPMITQEQQVKALFFISSTFQLRISRYYLYYYLFNYFVNSAQQEKVFNQDWETHRQPVGQSDRRRSQKLEVQLLVIRLALQQVGRPEAFPEVQRH